MQKSLNIGKHELEDKIEKDQFTIISTMAKIKYLRICLIKSVQDIDEDDFYVLQKESK